MPATASTQERRAPALAVVEDGYLVFCRVPLSELPPDKQKQIRDAYEDTNWASDYALAFVGIYTDLELAEREAARYDAGFVHSLPVNAPLPLEHKRYGIQLCPNSPAREYYEDTSPGLAQPTNGFERKKLEWLNQTLKDLCSNLRTLTS